MTEIKKETISCPHCEKYHIDVGEWATRPHHKHLCHYCHKTWRETDYIAGINTMRDMGEGTRYAEGFDSGCRYSNAQIAALEADKARHVNALKFIKARGCECEYDEEGERDICASCLAAGALSDRRLGEILAEAISAAKDKG